MHDDFLTSARTEVLPEFVKAPSELKAPSPQRRVELTETGFHVLKKGFSPHHTQYELRNTHSRMVYNFRHTTNTSLRAADAVSLAWQSPSQSWRLLRRKSMLLAMTKNRDSNMGITPKTVFISYRRTNFYTALAVYQDLTAHGYDVFFDYESIDSGDFETVIFENIRYRAHFVVILSPSALERLGEKNSVMRREVELAIDENRNIIPLMMESFDFGSPSAKAALTGKLEALSSYNGLKLVPEYIFAGMEKLRRFLNVELEAVRHQPVLSAVVEEDTEKRQIKAKAEPTVQEESLTAEEWFERGFRTQDTSDGIRFYKKAIELDPKNYAAYNNLGLLFLEKLKNYQEAEKNIRKAIEIHPTNATAHYNLGKLFETLENNVEAIGAYQKAIELNPKYALAYNNLGVFFKKSGQYSEAEKAYQKAIELEPEYAEAYNNLGNLFADIKHYDKAEKAYQKAIEVNPLEANFHKNFGSFLSDMKRYAEAKGAYLKAIQINPEDSEAYFKLGSLGEIQKDTEDALSNYNKALKFQENHRLARLSLYILLNQLGRKEEAKKHKNLVDKIIEETLEKGNEYDRACFESHCGNIDKAIDLLKVAIEKEQSSPAWAKQDPNLENLRADPRFWEIIGEEMPKQ